MFDPRTILFDWDGTLCDSGAASLRAFRASLADFGVEFTDEAYKAAYTPRWYLMYEALGLRRDLWEQADQRWLHHYGEEIPCLMAGAVDVLKGLHSQGILLGIVTNGTRPRIERELAALQLVDTFGAVVCHGDVPRSKPHPDGVLRALALVHSSPADSWYVGDTPVDIEQGRSAGTLTVGVLTDFVDPVRMREAGADLLLDSIRELPDAVADARIRAV